MQPQRRGDAETAAEGKLGFEDFHSRGHVEIEESPVTGLAIGACIEVHRELGPGLTELMYEEALCHEFDLRRVAYRRQVELPVIYKGKPIGNGRLDLLIDEQLILDLKSCEGITPVHRAQVITYLRLMKLQLPLIVNFNVAILKDGIKRVILTH